MPVDHDSCSPAACLAAVAFLLSASGLVWGALKTAAEAVGDEAYSVRFSLDLEGRPYM